MPDLNFRCNEVPVSNSYHHVLQPTCYLRRIRSAHPNPETLHPITDGNNRKQVSVHQASCYSCLDQSSNDPPDADLYAVHGAAGMQGHNMHASDHSRNQG